MLSALPFCGQVHIPKPSAGGFPFVFVIAETLQLKDEVCTLILFIPAEFALFMNGDGYYEFTCIVTNSEDAGAPVYTDGGDHMPYLRTKGDTCSRGLG